MFNNTPLDTMCARLQMRRQSLKTRPVDSHKAGMRPNCFARVNIPKNRRSWIGMFTHHSLAMLFWLRPTSQLDTNRMKLEKSKQLKYVEVQHGEPW